MSNRRIHGHLRPLTREYKRKRQEKRKRKGTWAARVWVRRHVLEKK